MRKIILLILIIGLKVNLTAQVPTIQWEKSFGGSMNDRGYSICNGSNGDFIIAGTTESSDGDISINKGFSDLWLIRIDSTGNLIWEKTLGGRDDEEACTVLKTYDGGYIILGETTSNDSDVSGLHMPNPFIHSSDGWLVKTDSSGIIQWQKCIGGTDLDFGRDLTICLDSNYLITERIESSDGDVTNFHGGYDDYWLAKIDQSGNITWGNAFGGNSDDYPTCCTQTTDGNYIISGCSLYNFGGYHGPPGAGGGDIGLVKVDSSGNKIWSKCYGGTGGECARSIIPADNGGFFLVSENSSFDGDISTFYGDLDFWILYSDINGSIIWEKSYGGSGFDRPFQIIKSSDGGLVITGFTNSNDQWVSNNHGNDDFWVLKLDSLGNFEWEKSLGGTDEDRAYSILETPDGGYIVCGYTLSNNIDVTSNHGNEDVWVVKLSPPTLGIQTPENQFADFTAFQNDDQLIIRFFSKHSGTSQITFSNTLGKIILEKEITFREGINYTSINLPAITEGMYFINATGKGIGKGKVFIK